MNRHRLTFAIAVGRISVLVAIVLGADCCPLAVSNAVAQEAQPQGPTAEQANAAESVAPLDPVEARKAAVRGLAVLQRAAEKYPQHRQCFSCHHQTLPMLAQVTARQRGVSIDDNLIQAQLEFTSKTFDRRVEDLQRGEGIGGKGMTVGYGLWAIMLADGKPNETTEAMVAFLLKTQRDEGHWTGQTCRPPLEESYQTCTVLAVQGIQKYATESQREQAAAAVAKAKQWLSKAPAKGQEDRAARLWGLNILGGTDEELRAAREAVLKAQRSDGGWAQIDEMDSDAYATGQTLSLLQATGLSATDPAYRRGVQFLLTTQQPGGEWLVVSRSKPIQPYFDSDDEDPLGKNQFISIPATSWAVVALSAAAATSD